MPIPHKMKMALKRSKIKSKPDDVCSYADFIKTKISSRPDELVFDLNLFAEPDAKSTLYQLAMETILASPDLSDISKSRNPDKDYFSVPVSVGHQVTGQNLSTEVIITVREVLNSLRKK